MPKTTPLDLTKILQYKSQNQNNRLKEIILCFYVWVSILNNAKVLRRELDVGKKSHKNKISCLCSVDSVAILTRDSPRFSLDPPKNAPDGHTHDLSVYKRTSVSAQSTQLLPPAQVSGEVFPQLSSGLAVLSVRERSVWRAEGVY